MLHRQTRSTGHVRRRWRSGGVALTALLLLPGYIAAQGGIRVEKTTWVPATKDPVDNCERLRKTLDALPAGQDHVVLLSAGAYWCLSSTLIVPHRVVLEGAGPGTLILGNIDNAALGVVHLEGNAELRRVQVQNSESSPANAAIAVSAWELSSLPGGPDLVDVDAYVSVSSGAAYPLWLAEENAVVDGGSFKGGNIRLAGGNFDFLLEASAIEGVDADPTVTPKCYFYLNLLTGVPSSDPSGTCP